MDPRIIASGITAILRIAQVGSSLYVEYATDRAVFLPNLPKYKLSRRDILDDYVRSNNLQTSMPFSLIMGSNNRVSNANRLAFDEAFAEMTLRLAKTQEGENIYSDLDSLQDKDKQQRIHARAGGELIEQWRKEDTPPSALARAALTLTDIALEFVVSHPSLMGVDSKGERFIRAFAMNLTQLIPNSADAFGAQENFSHRVLATFFRAGLSASLSQVDNYLEQEHEQALFKAIVQPVIESLPNNIADHYFYRHSIDALLAPAASAAFKVLAKHQSAFIGEHVEGGSALGVVVQGLLLNMGEQEGGLKKVFSQAGAMQIYQSTLEIAAKHPALFVAPKANDDNAHGVNYARDIFVLVTGKLAQQRLSKSVKVNIAMAVLSITSDKAAQLLGGVGVADVAGEKPLELWPKLAVDLIEQITQAMRIQLEQNKPISEVLSHNLQSALIRTALTSIQKSPHMLGVKRQSTLAILSAVAGAIANDTYKLLSDDDWLIIAKLMTDIAASDIARLSLDLLDDENGIAVADALNTLMHSVVKECMIAASNAWKDEINQRLSPRFLLHKDTLRQAIVVILHGLKGNITGLKQTSGLINAYLSSLLDYAQNHANRIGSDTFIRMIDSSIASVLMTGELPSIEQLLVGIEDMS